MVCWVGLDVGATEIVACAVDVTGERVAERTIPNCANQVRQFCDEIDLPIERIGLEAGSSSIDLYRKLRLAGFLFNMFDTRQASKFLKIRQNKTDLNDARGLADLARLGHGVISEVYVKSSEFQQLRSGLALRQKLVRHRVACEHAMLSTFRVHGGNLPRSHTANRLRDHVTAELSRLKDTEDLDLSTDILPVLEICETTRKYIENKDRELARFASGNPICSRFMDIPGVGFLTAISFYSAIEDPDRFLINSDVGAYFGLVPKVHQSGNSARYLAISRMGNKLTRSHLVVAAGSMLGSVKADCALRDWALAIASRTNKRRARAALARKLAVVMISMWKSATAFQPWGPPLPTLPTLPPLVTSRWTDDDDAVLRENYESMPTAILARKLRRSLPATYHRAYRLGLSKSPRAREQAG